MVYESSYESGRQPFLPDTKRGQWLNPHDFIYAGISLALRVDTLSMSWLFAVETGIFSLIPVYFLSMVIYIIPLMVIQSFMGQFSSSGFISAFRLSPIFKGIGYVTLGTNICVLAYHSIFAMVPLVYMFASMQPTLPWSCEGFEKWAHNLTESQKNNLCNIKSYNESDILEYFDEETNETISFTAFENHHIPSVLYFNSLFHDWNLFQYDDMEFSMSWQLIICVLLVWSIIAIIVYKYFQTSKIGQLIRYSVWTVIGLMSLFVLRFSFLPGASHVFRRAFTPSLHDFLNSLTTVPIYGLSAFGPGWGLFVTLASYNKFKTNIIKSSWFIAAGQFGITIGLHLLTNFTEHYFKNVSNDNYFSNVEYTWILYLSSGSAMAHMTWANLWSILYFFMLFLATMILLVLQLHSILTAIYDEFVYLRDKKLAMAMGVIATVAVMSLYFTSNHGITYVSALAVDTYFTQTAINLLLILIVLWIYGRERFQRDIEFMTNQKFPTWSIYILRFIAPFGMVLALIGSFTLSHYEHDIAPTFITVIALVFIVIPWLSIPGYALYQMSRSMGTIKMRFLRCCRSTDWFPVDTEERQKYEQTLGNVEITHTLNGLKDEDVA